MTIENEMMLNQKRCTKHNRNKSMSKCKDKYAKNYNDIKNDVGVDKSKVFE